MLISLYRPSLFSYMCMYCALVETNNILFWMSRSFIVTKPFCKIRSILNQPLSLDNFFFEIDEFMSPLVNVTTSQITFLMTSPLWPIIIISRYILVVAVGHVFCLWVTSENQSSWPWWKLRRASLDTNCAADMSFLRVCVLEMLRLQLNQSEINWDIPLKSWCLFDVKFLHGHRSHLLNLLNCHLLKSPSIEIS